MDDSQSVELRGRGGMAMTVSGVQQCWTMTLAEIALRRMGRANGSRECAPDDRLRETHHLAARMMGIAALHPSYKRGTLERRERRTRKFGWPIDRVFKTHFRLNPDIAPRSFLVPRAERFRYAAIVQQPSP